MFFHRPQLHPSKFGHKPDQIILCNPHPYTLTPTSQLKYLGVFFTPSLNWTPHVKIMAAHACSTICALQVIGNSVQGLYLPGWQKVFLAIILPVLTYRHQVWFTDVHQKSLIQILHIAQNKGCRKIGGVFKTTLVNLIECLLSIPPICFCLCHLSQQAGARLLCLPPSSALHNPSFTQKSITAPCHIAPLPILPQVCEVPMRFPPFSLLPPHCLPLFSHPCFTILSKNHHNFKNAIDNTISLKIFLTSTPSPPSTTLTLFAIFLNNKLHLSNFMFGQSLLYSRLVALICVLAQCPIPPLLIHIFSSNHPLFSTILHNQDAHLAVTSQALQFSLTTFFTNNPLTSVIGVWLLRKQSWSWKVP